MREKSRIGGREEVDSAHLGHGARRKVGRAGRGYVLRSLRRS